MTKRILAAFLVVMMVVAMVPTTVFAADECAVLAQYEDHSKEHCAKAGVEYTMVPNSTVKPECGQDGYTLYQCACGEYFADDIVPMDPHHTESGEPKIARIEPTCYKVGKVAVYTCDLCGKDYFDPADLAASNVNTKGQITKLPHTFDDVSYPGNDCTAAEQVCQNEGCTAKNDKFKPEKEHKWDYDDPHAIVKAPTETEKGEAIFKCSNEGCAQTKTVEVLELDHTHKLVKVKEEKSGEGCVITTVAEHYKCEKCGKLYTDNTAATETTLKKLTTTTDHDWNDDPVIIEATCTTWGFSYYGCPTCGATKGVTPETEQDDMTKYKPLGHTPYACPDHPEEADKNCAVCADAAKSYDQSYTAPTCEKKGSYDWKCGRCHEDRNTPIDETGHEKVTVKVTQSHAFAYTYTYTYCTNEYCDRDAVEEYTFSKGTYKGITFDVTVEVRDGNVYDLPAGTTVHLIAAPTSIAKKTSGFVHFFVEDKKVQAPNCTDDGKAFWYCAGENGCNTYYDEVLEALGHDYSDTTNDKAATCTTNAFKVCDREGCTHEEEQLNTKGHKMDTKPYDTKLPLCDGTKGYEVYKCTVQGCNYEENRNYTDFIKNKTYLGVEKITLAGVETSLTSKEEFEMEHPEFDGTYVEYRAGDCLNNGYWKAECDGCEKTYLVLIDGTGKGHKAPAGTTYYEEADCLNAQGYVNYNCDSCGQLVKNTNKPLGHDMEKHPAVPATCTKGGNKEYYTCSRACCEDILYKDKDGKGIFGKDEHLIAELGHDYADTVVEVNCTTPGFTHKICGNCADEFVCDYIAPTGHTRGQDVSEKAYCIVDGCTSYLCSNAGCTGDDGIAGTEDDGIESYQVVPATGHKNAKGQTITNICTDTVTDRVCVSCNNADGVCATACAADLVKNSKKKWEVKKDHTETEVIVEAGCEHYGYKMVTCANGCGKLDNVTELVEPTGHLAPWGAYIKVEDMTAINEDVCGWYGEDFLATEAENYTGYITAYKAPTYEALGSITFECCAHCGDEVTRDVIRTGVDFIIEADNAAVSGSNDIVEDGKVVGFRPVDGDVIAYEITMNAYQTNVWGFNFDVYYNAASMNFLGYTYNAGQVFGNHKLNNITEDYLIYEFDVENEDVNGNSINDLYGTVEDVEGLIKFSAYTENDINGKIKDALINGTQSVVTLYFQVEAKFDYTFMGVSGSDFDNSVWVDMQEGHNSWSYATVVNSEGEVANEVDDDYSYASAMLDINDSGDVTITDLYFCNQILTGDAEYEYLASADANKDGQITITDLDLMNQLLQGADESVIYGALTWTAPEGFIAS